MFDSWFMWALIGIVFIGLEMIMPGFVIFFFGMGALATALVSLIPFVSDVLWLQVLLFIVFSILSLVFLRSHFTRIFAGTVFDSKRPDTAEDGIGETAEVLEAAGPVKEGRIRFRGTSWKAVTNGEELPSGTLVRTVSRSGMTYTIERAADPQSAANKDKE